MVSYRLDISRQYCHSSQKRRPKEFPSMVQRCPIEGTDSFSSPGSGNHAVTERNCNEFSMKPNNWNNYTWLKLADTVRTQFVIATAMKQNSTAAFVLAFSREGRRREPAHRHDTFWKVMLSFLPVHLVQASLCWKPSAPPSLLEKMWLRSRKLKTRGLWVHLRDELVERISRTTLQLLWVYCLRERQIFGINSQTDLLK